jgi:hypothetical protein
VSGLLEREKERKRAKEMEDSCMRGDCGAVAQWPYYKQVLCSFAIRCRIHEDTTVRTCMHFLFRRFIANRICRHVETVDDVGSRTAIDCSESRRSFMRELGTVST